MSSDPASKYYEDPSLPKSHEILGKELARQMRADKNQPIFENFDNYMREYSAGTLQQRIQFHSWLTESVLQSDGRSMQGTDGVFVLQTEQVYVNVISEMVDRMRGDSRLIDKIAKSKQLSPIERNSACPVHPYGRIVVMCECRRPIGRAMPEIFDKIDGCCCSPYSHGFTSYGSNSFNHSVTCFTVHSVCGDGTCRGVRGLDGKLSVVRDNLPMFARLARYLFTYANNQFIVREILGGPYSGYLQVAVMIAMRFSVSDTVRVAGGHRQDFLSYDVPEFSEDGRTQFIYQMVKLRKQGFYRGWMNNLVQNSKRRLYGEPLLTDAEFRDKFIRRQVTEIPKVQVPSVVVVPQPQVKKRDKLIKDDSPVIQIKPIVKATRNEFVASKPVSSMSYQEKLNFSVLTTKTNYDRERDIEIDKGFDIDSPDYNPSRGIFAARREYMDALDLRREYQQKIETAQDSVKAAARNRSSVWSIFGS